MTDEESAVGDDDGAGGDPDPATGGGPGAGDGSDPTTGDGAGTEGESLLERLDSYPLPEGLVGGVVSFLTGYVFVSGLLASTESIDLSDGFVAVGRSLGYLFYNALSVPTYLRANATRTVTRTAENGTVVARRRVVVTTEQWQNQITGTRTVERSRYVNDTLVANASQSGTFDPGLAVPALVYLAIPVVALLAVGYVYGDRWFDVEEWDPNALTVQSLVGGFALTIGYLLVALAGTYLLVRTGSDGQSVLYPARLPALTSGVVYPLLAGTVGVALGQLSTDDLRRAREAVAADPPDGGDAGGNS